MSTAKWLYFVLNVSVILVGGGYLFFLSNIDGVYVSRPVTFFVDTNNLQTDKAVYHKGDDISLKWAFCKNRNFTAQTTYLLVNSVITTYTPRAPVSLTPGCYGTDRDRYVEAIEILPNALKGTHHIEGSSTYTLDHNPLHQITIHFRSRDFDIQ